MMYFVSQILGFEPSVTEFDFDHCVRIFKQVMVGFELVPPTDLEGTVCHSVVFIAVGFFIRGMLESF